jgi:hypothetical protein
MDIHSGDHRSTAAIDDDQVLVVVVRPRDSEEVGGRAMGSKRPRSRGEHGGGDPLLTCAWTANQAGDTGVDVLDVAAA